LNSIDQKNSKIFRFSITLDSNRDIYAVAYWKGTWYVEPGDLPVCPECGISLEKRIQPLIIEWEPGSDIIGDFTVTGSYYDMVVTQRVREAIEGKFTGFEFHPVEMYQKPSLKRPTRITKRTKPRVWLPYEGPPLWDFWIMGRAQWDLEKSRISISKVCKTCGKIFHNQPPEGHPLVLDVDNWNGCDVFRVPEYSRFVYCMDNLKNFIEEKEFTNVSFLEVGYAPSVV